MATSFSGEGSRSTRREPLTMGKQLVNLITCEKEKEATKRLIQNLALFIYDIKDYLTENEITVSVGEGLNSKDFYLHIFLFRNCFH
jgi:hypothetical protein